MTTKAKKPEVKKPVAVAKAKPVAKKPAAKPVVKKETKVEQPKVIPQTIAEAAKNKKAVVKVTKEEELSRRLTRAKSSLMAGVAAAIKVDAPAPAAKDDSPVGAKPSYMEKPVTTQQAKKSDKVSFDALNQAEEAKTAPKPAKPSTGKVSFDTLMGDTGQAPAQDLDLATFYKK